MVMVIVISMGTSRPLAGAHSAPDGEFPHGDLETASRYLERNLLLAEAVGDPEELAVAMIGLGTRYQGLGAPTAARGPTEMAADIARARDLPALFANALVNVGTLEMSRDLPCALDTFGEALDVALRSGICGMLDWSYGNYASALWTAGRLGEAAAVLSEPKEFVHVPTIKLLLGCVDSWLADACGGPPPPLPKTDSTGNSWDLAALGNLEVLARVAAGDTEGAAALAEGALSHALADGGLDDDFIHFWPALVRAALADDDVALAQRLLEPATTAAPGIVSPAVAAQLRNLRGLIGSARGDNASEIEADLRADVAALADFGGVGWSARAEEDLGRWLVTQGRCSDAEMPLGHAREVYREVDADGWLARLDTWLASHASTEN